LAHVASQHQGMMLVEGKRTYVFQLGDGRRATGQDFLQRVDWPWRDSPQEPGVRYARLMATSPTYGRVHGHYRRQPGPRSLLSVLPGDDLGGAASDSGLGPAELD